MQSPRLPAGRPFSTPTPMRAGIEVPVRTVFPTQYHSVEEATSPLSEATATAAVRDIAAYHANRTLLGQPVLFGRASTEERFCALLQGMLRAGCRYNWPCILQPLEIGGGDRSFQSSRAYLQSLFDGKNGLGGQQTSMRQQLSGLLCFARAVLDSTHAMRHDPEVARLSAATGSLLQNAERRLTPVHSRWVRSQRDEVEKAIKLLARQERVNGPKRRWLSRA